MLTQGVLHTHIKMFYYVEFLFKLRYYDMAKGFTYLHIKDLFIFRF